MRTLLMSMAVAASLVACSGGEAAPEAKPEVKAEAKPEPKPEPKAEPAAVAFDAKAEFGKTCSTCHGPEGKGDGPAAAALTPKPANFTDPAFWEGRDDASIAKVIKEGGAAVGKSPLMAPYGGMYDDDKIASIAAYIIETYKPKS